ncbi:MASE3 domain-containing protein [Bacillus sp. T3]|uniref:MASE3 domain-containing protein n=1 Tax=Bacillus sp. T3 TaxID=467262 RepID=UPI0029810E65|nr:MASE3 domain-containing protein [Bacillus sp. T3]
MKNFQNISKEQGIVVAGSFVLLLAALFFRESLYGIFGEQNYLTIHLIMEIFIVSLALTIAIQSWVVFPHSLSRYRLWIGALFFSVWILELAHAIAYKGMPYFLSESSSYKATWLFIATRLTEVVGMMLIVVTRDNYVASNRRFISYSSTFFTPLFGYSSYFIQLNCYLN